MIGDQNQKMQAAQEAAEIGGFGGAMAHAMSMFPTPGKMAGFNNYRYQQTMLKGGFYDDARLSRGKFGKAIGRDKFRIYKDTGSMKPTDLSNRSFAFGSKFGKETSRGERMLARAAEGTRGTAGMAGGFRANYMNPSHMFSGRMHSTTVFGAGSHSNFYAPVQGGMMSTTGNSIVNGGRALKRFAGGGSLKTPVGEKPINYFNGGMVGRLGAVARAEKMAPRKLATMNRSLSRVMVQNNASLGSVIKANGSISAARLGADTGHLIGMGGSTPAERIAVGRSMATSNTGQIGAYRSLMGMEGAAPVTNGMRRYATTEGMTGKYTKSFTQNLLTSGGGMEMRTMNGTVGRTVAFGVENIAMTEAAEKIIKPLAGALGENAGLMNRALGRGVSAGTHLASSLAPEMVEARAGLMATEIIDRGIIKSLGARGAAQAVKSAGIKGGARVGLAVGGEALLAAIPGVNLVFAADMAYNLAKLAGAGVKAGINFAKDGMKSMTGTMNNGLFGNGYKDNEVAATSRARGVSAIQNSRLNARSLLGSEGAMMHAHFG
jgi:hypothetical protein